MQLHTIGIDLGKTLFHLVGLNQRGEVVVRKKFSRKQLLHFTAINSGLPTTHEVTGGLWGWEWLSATAIFCRLRFT